MNILEEAEEVVQKLEHKQKCERCPWNRLCIEPPEMTTEEVEARMSREAPADVMAKGELGTAFYKLMDGMLFAGKDKSCIACPVFISRLRENPKLSQEIKRLMQEWGSVET